MCPTCAHTMQSVGTPDNQAWWCPRCGTIKMGRGDRPGEVETPRWMRLLRDAEFPQVYREWMAAAEAVVAEMQGEAEDRFHPDAALESVERVIECTVLEWPPGVAEAISDNLKRAKPKEGV